MKSLTFCRFRDRFFSPEWFTFDSARGRIIRSSPRVQRYLMTIPDSSTMTPQVVRGFRDLQTDDERVEVLARADRMEAYKKLPRDTMKEILDAAELRKHSDEMQNLADGSCFPKSLDDYVDQLMQART